VSLDKASVLGILLAVGGILAGLLLEGGNLGQVLQPTAAMIVFGGTLGAVMIQFPLPIILLAFKQFGSVFFNPRHDPEATIDRLVQYAQKARREGIVALDSELEEINDPFLRKTLMLAIDGTEPQELRKMIELELDNQAEYEEQIPQVFESAGGFAPTVGIIGAVLGLIQTMQHLDKIDEVGRGIAVAFVATIYGVGSANLLYLPIAGKMKIRARNVQILREMTLEGVISILEGMNPHMLETARPKPRRRNSDPTQKIQGSRQPRALAGLLCRFHHALIRILRGALRFLAGGSTQSRQARSGHSDRLSGDGRFSRLHHRNPSESERAHALQHGPGH
jgi:chemotaxis protein MotA